MRRLSKEIKIGRLIVGGNYPIAVQSMTNIPASNYSDTLKQVIKLQETGCDIVRIACPKIENASIFDYLKKNGVTIPLVADIHFDYKIALETIKNGVDKVRINPGNIGEAWKVEQVVNACKSEGIPIRIGVNGGSLEKKLLEKYGSPTSDALAESALVQAEQLEKFGFSNILISIKSSSIITMNDAVRKVAKQCNYPLHLGVTEAGTEYSGIVKNSIGIGSLLSEGIGDTIRVSLTADPVKEVECGKEILKSLGLVKEGINIISCPTCGRTQIDLINIANKYREASKSINTNGKYITVAIMGCVVNGPGEAREADFGIAGGDGCAVLFKKGEIIGKIDENNIVEALIEETINELK